MADRALAASRVLAFAAVLEVATGLALMLDPALVSNLLLGAEVVGAKAALGRCFGIALLALGVACWQRDESSASTVRAMLIYNLLIALYLAYLGMVGQMAGVLLWPAVALHAAVATALIWTRPSERLPATRLRACLLLCVLAAATPAMSQQVLPEPSAEEPAPIPSAVGFVEEEEASVAGFLAGRLGLVEQHFSGLASALPTLPAELAAAVRRLTDELSERGLVEVIPLLVAFVGLGIGAELLFARATAPLAARTRAAAVASVRHRLRARPD